MKVTLIKKVGQRNTLVQVYWPPNDIARFWWQKWDWKCWVGQTIKFCFGHSIEKSTTTLTAKNSVEKYYIISCNNHKSRVLIYPDIYVGQQCNFCKKEKKIMTYFLEVFRLKFQIYGYCYLLLSYCLDDINFIFINTFMARTLIFLS